MARSSYYIRFLRIPQCESIAWDTFKVNALVTVTTDLGDDYLPEEISLYSAVVGATGNTTTTTAWRCSTWIPSKRVVSITCEHVRIPPPGKEVAFIVSSRQSAEPDYLHVSCLPVVFSVRCSLIPDPSGGGLKAYERLERRLQTSQTSISVFEDVGESIARHIWDAAAGTVAYLDQLTASAGQSVPERPPGEQQLYERLRRQGRVLELGSGCGVVGLWIASIFPEAQVMLTDCEEAMGILQWNIQHQLAERASPATPNTRRLESRVLRWEEALPAEVKAWARHLDVIVLSDCTYNWDSVPSLVCTLRRLVSQQPSTLVLVSMKVRHESESAFFAQMQSGGFQELHHARIGLASDDGLSRLEPAGGAAATCTSGIWPNPDRLGSSQPDPNLVHIFVYQGDQRKAAAAGT